MSALVFELQALSHVASVTALPHQLVYYSDTIPMATSLPGKQGEGKISGLEQMSKEKRGWQWKVWIRVKTKSVDVSRVTQSPGDTNPGLLKDSVSKSCFFLSLFLVLRLNCFWRLFIIVCVSMCAHLQSECGGQAGRSWFSASTLYLFRIDLVPAGLGASAFAC